MTKHLPVSILPALLVLAGLMLGGCASTPLDKPEKRYFVVDARRSDGGEAGQPSAVLLIRRFKVSPRFEGTQMVYRVGESEYQADYYNEFFIPPSAMITEATRDWLASSGRFKAVFDSPGQLPPDLVLEGLITSLYGDVRDRDHPQAAIGVQFFLTDQNSGAKRLIFQGDFESRMPADNAAPADLIRAYNRALSDILGRLESSLPTR